MRKNKKMDLLPIIASYSIIALFIICVFGATIYMGISDRTRQQETAQVNK